MDGLTDFLGSFGGVNEFKGGVGAKAVGSNGLIDYIIDMVRIENDSGKITYALRCPGGHGQMDLIEKPPHLGKGKVYVCPKFRTLNDRVPVSMLAPNYLAEMSKTKTIDDDAISRCSNDMCWICFDERMPIVWAVKYSGGHVSDLWGRRVIFKMPHWSQACDCDRRKMITASEDGFERVYPCCMVGPKTYAKKADEVMVLGRMQALCWASMKATMNVRGASREGWCKNSYVNLELDSHNATIFDSFVQLMNGPKRAVAISEFVKWGILREKEASDLKAAEKSVVQTPCIETDVICISKGSRSRSRSRQSFSTSESSEEDVYVSKRKRSKSKRFEKQQQQQQQQRQQLHEKQVSVLFNSMHRII